MEVLAYQAFIAASIVVTRLFVSNYLLLVCLGWTAFTLINLFWPPLIAIQLVVVWGTYYFVGGGDIATSSSEKEQREFDADTGDPTKPSTTLSQDLDAILYGSDNANGNEIFGILDEKKEVIQGAEHLNFLHSAIRDAEVYVAILSGWVSQTVVTEKFIDTLEKKAMRGCRIFIGFGYEDFEGNHSQSTSSKIATRRLLELQKRRPNQVFVGKFANHEKILVRDGSVVVFGSNNWLSNSTFSNSERSIAVYSDELAEKEGARILSASIGNRLE